MKVVIVTPNESDRSLASAFLAAEGLATETCSSLTEAAPRIGQGVGCIVIVEEAVTADELGIFHEALAAQPAWSDLPLLLIAAQGSSLVSLVENVFPVSGNVTVLQRPLHPVSLVSSVNVAVRARRRQYQVRDLLAERERALRQRDEFLAMLGHELRNPLAPIRNAVYLLDTVRCDDPVFVKCRAMIDKQTRHITRLVDDLLDASRLELGKVELRLQTVDLNDVIEAAVEACLPMTNEHRHAISARKAAKQLVVRADPVRLEQAIGNLIVNAAKFTRAGGTITVEAHADDGWGVVAVTDNGVGIRPEMLETIFDLFAQSEVALARTEGGLGIGLTVMKRLVELHGGSVKASSAGPGTGARFEARLPLVALEAEVAGAPRPVPASASRRILVAEDREDTRESLGLLMRRWNHEVSFATNGPDAVSLARALRPDVALIDIGLPGFDGYAVAREIRGEGTSWARSVRLVALTGYGQASDRTRALESGFDVHLLKPVDPLQLQVALAATR